ncbi:MAG: helix-turn-helix transcriptional regulator [Oscillospiraceae bacterium]|nr:helix-turn-helix transcriptional regulator [Oscillospiraceae bacterium]
MNPSRLTTLDALCALLNCEISDIIEYIPDNRVDIKK